MWGLDLSDTRVRGLLWRRNISLLLSIWHTMLLHDGLLLHARLAILIDWVSRGRSSIRGSSVRRRNLGFGISSTVAERVREGEFRSRAKPNSLKALVHGEDGEHEDDNEICLDEEPTEPRKGL